MDSSVKDLSSYRINRAEEMLQSAESTLNNDDIRTSLNRSYYAIFHAMRALNALDGFDSSKHSGVIAHFNQFFVKTGKIDSRFSNVVKDASYLREKADYDDFYIVSRKEAIDQLESAKGFLEEVKAYIGSIEQGS